MSFYNWSNRFWTSTSFWKTSSLILLFLLVCCLLMASRSRIFNSCYWTLVWSSLIWVRRCCSLELDICMEFWSSSLAWLFFSSISDMCCFRLLYSYLDSTRFCLRFRISAFRFLIATSYKVIPSFLVFSSSSLVFSFLMDSYNSNLTFSLSSFNASTSFLSTSFSSNRIWFPFSRF